MTILSSADSGTGAYFVAGCSGTVAATVISGGAYSYDGSASGTGCDVYFVAGSSGTVSVIGTSVGAYV